MLFLICFGIHFKTLTVHFADLFYFHDADYIGIDEVIRELGRGEGFHSSYYSESGKDTYLLHHFAPALFFYLPFVSFFPERWGYAAGSFFYGMLGVSIWAYLLYFKFSERKEKQNLVTSGSFFLLWVCLFNQLYIYRLITGYHFEVLVLPFSGLFFYFYQRALSEQKTYLIALGLWISLLLFLSIKEDIAVYLSCFIFLSQILSIDRKDFLKNKKWKEELKQKIISTHFAILVFCSLYFLFTVWMYPSFAEGKETISWSNELVRNYSSSYKQVEGISKSLKIYLEILVSGGSGIVMMIPEFLGLSLIYLFHAVSSRPWHHEVYSYYSYSLLPFLLYTGLVWLGKEKRLPIWVLFLFLTLLFGKNSLDGNFPLSLEENKNTIKEAEARSRLKEELSSGVLEIPQGEIVYSQYNLSFYIPKENPVRPLPLIDSECGNQNKTGNPCYVVLAKEFTSEELYPSERLKGLSFGLKENQAVLLFQGQFLEVWKF